MFGTLALLGEAVALADGLGLSRDVTFDVLAATPLAGPAERRRPAIEDGDYPLRFALALARKDAELIIEAARGGRASTSASSRPPRAWLADAEEAGFGDRDYSTVLARIIGTD